MSWSWPWPTRWHGRSGRCWPSAERSMRTGIGVRFTAWRKELRRRTATTVLSGDDLVMGRTVGPWGSKPAWSHGLRVHDGDEDFLREHSSGPSVQTLHRPDIRLLPPLYSIDLVTCQPGGVHISDQGWLERVRRSTYPPPPRSKLRSTNINPPPHTLAFTSRFHRLLRRTICSSQQHILG